MSKENGSKIIHAGTPEAETFFANIKRAMAITPVINRLTFDDAEKIRTLFSDLTGRKVDDDFQLIPPVYTANGLEIRISHRVFINQNCTLYDLAEIRIDDRWRNCG